MSIDGMVIELLSSDDEQPQPQPQPQRQDHHHQVRRPDSLSPPKAPVAKPKSSPASGSMAKSAASSRALLAKRCSWKDAGSLASPKAAASAHAADLKRKQQLFTQFPDLSPILGTKKQKAAEQAQPDEKGKGQEGDGQQAGQSKGQREHEQNKQLGQQQQQEQAGNGQQREGNGKMPNREEMGTPSSNRKRARDMYPTGAESSNNEGTPSQASSGSDSQSKGDAAPSQANSGSGSQSKGDAAPSQANSGSGNQSKSDAAPSQSNSGSGIQSNGDAMPSQANAGSVAQSSEQGQTSSGLRDLGPSTGDGVQQLTSEDSLSTEGSQSHKEGLSNSGGGEDVSDSPFNKGGSEGGSSEMDIDSNRAGSGHSDGLVQRGRTPGAAVQDAVPQYTEVPPVPLPPNDRGLVYESAPYTPKNCPLLEYGIDHGARDYPSLVSDLRSQIYSFGSQISDFGFQKKKLSYSAIELRGSKGLRVKDGKTVKVYVGPYKGQQAFNFEYERE
eukprot:gene19045-25643_t